MWSVALELMTHFEEEDIRYVLGLPNLTSAVIGMKQTSKTPDSEVNWHTHMLKV